VDSRRQRLNRSRLYLVCETQPDSFLQAVLAAGVDLVQLRMKEAPAEEIVRTAVRFRRACAEHGALLILNDRPDLVAAAGADGVHVGQDDVAVVTARSVVGPDRLVGLSTHTRAQIDAATGVDYIGVGPVFETPTKPGRPAVGLELVAYAAARADVPFFAIGGIALDNIARVREAGAQRVAVVRALTEAGWPGRAARDLKGALVHPQRREAYVGTT
jgi:thiamine-phosphate pyrophosphorylase